MYDTKKPYTEFIKNEIKKTWRTPYLWVRETNGEPFIQHKFVYPVYDHSDGIGSKGVYHWLQRSFRYAVYDALAMNLNDLVLMRALPYKLQNHIFIPQDDHDAVKAIIKNLAEECIGRSIAITGGETEIDDTIRGVKIGITMSGFIPRAKENMFRAGDMLIGIQSSGLHSNGFTKVRELFGEKNAREEFIEPTRVYSDIMFHVLEKFDIHGMAHITGSAFSKPITQKFLASDADLYIARNHILRPHGIFKEIYKKGVSDEEMYTTFNCGIGFLFSIDAKKAKDALAYLLNFADADIIGEVTPGSRHVRIESAFSKKEITL